MAEIKSTFKNTIKNENPGIWAYIILPFFSHTSSHTHTHHPKHTLKVVNYLIKVHDFCYTVCIQIHVYPEAAVFKLGNTYPQHLTSRYVRAFKGINAMDSLRVLILFVNLHIFVNIDLHQRVPKPPFLFSLIIVPLILCK